MASAMFSYRGFRGLCYHTINAISRVTCMTIHKPQKMLNYLLNYVMAQLSAFKVYSAA